MVFFIDFYFKGWRHFSKYFIFGSKLLTEFYLINLIKKWHFIAPSYFMLGDKTLTSHPQKIFVIFFNFIYLLQFQVSY